MVLNNFAIMYMEKMFFLKLNILMVIFIMVTLLMVTLMDMLDELRTQYDLSIFLSTHDFATLSSFADKVILLNKKVLKKGKPEEVLSSPEFYETFHLRMGKGGEE